MALSEALREGLETIPGCRSVCYVDMRAGLVLGAQSHKPCPQERYDRMADMAARLFSEGVLSLVEHAAETAPDTEFTVCDPSGATVFVRGTEEPDHALCCQCDLPVDPPEISDAMRSLRRKVTHVFSKM